MALKEAAKYQGFRKVNQNINESRYVYVYKGKVLECKVWMDGWMDGWMDVLQGGY